MPLPPPPGRAGPGGYLLGTVSGAEGKRGTASGADVGRAARGPGGWADSEPQYGLSDRLGERARAVGLEGAGRRRRGVRAGLSRDEEPAECGPPASPAAAAQGLEPVGRGVDLACHRAHEDECNDEN
jgi:hypothetical protein